MKKSLFFLIVTLLCASPLGASGQNSTKGKIKGHEWVDLGLSVKWATCNIGADRPTDYGDYFAWGETATKKEYSITNCATCDLSPNILLSSIAGKSRFDAARSKWGGSWRLPTEEEMDELREKCEWTWTSRDNKNGYLVTGPSGESIFLPAGGFRCDDLEEGVLQRGAAGDYWTSKPVYLADEEEDPAATSLYFRIDLVSSDGFGKRHFGMLIRPVSK